MEATRMRVTFYRGIGIPFNGDSIQTGIGGLETQAITLARKLAERGYEVDFYVVGENEGVYNGVHYKPLADFIENCDVLIGVDCLPDNKGNKTGKWIGWALTSGINNILEADLIVCDSRWTLELYKGQYPEKNYSMIPCGFDYNLYVNNCEKMINSIMFAGHPMKGMDKLPDIFKKVKGVIEDARCEVFGGSMLWKDGNPAYKETYDKLTEAGINFYGMVEREIIINAFKTNEIYFLPRSEYTETFGLSVVEAMASGCVPVCSKRGNLPYLVNDSCGILIDEGIDEAQVLIDLMRDKDKIKRLRTGAKEVAKKYDWTNIIYLWEGVLR
jgi:glycosyltransferase involved in cell wall biosynthesis